MIRAGADGNKGIVAFYRDCTGAVSVERADVFVGKKYFNPPARGCLHGSELKLGLGVQTVVSQG